MPTHTDHRDRPDRRPRRSRRGISAELIASAVAQHSGKPITPEQVKWIADPEVSGTYAARVTGFYDLADGNHLDLLFILGGEPLSVDALDDALEEVEYASWPPAAGAPRFFS